MSSLIASRPGVMGGAPCVAGTRITVACLVSCREGGWDDAMILRQYPALTAEQLAAVWEHEAERRSEAKVQQNIQIAAREHRRILVRSRAAAQTRTVR